ncbi:glutamate--cysteine ligase regulatory subunit-like [Oppia nitens]|uniref:glutamate--cysteine ligase regulatory subunit-like n=1 Tax=Oppia nitens TaxID=1686743 RepID=UPI0023DBF136|nr:glutamate--cysteine ligase regulatory subunit-like [Oppia nitens]
MSSPSLPSDVDCLVIDSGNLLTLADIKRKVSILPNEELANGMLRVVNKWQQSSGARISGRTAFVADDSNQANSLLLSADRQSYRITVKLFVFDDVCCGGCGGGGGTTTADCPSLANGVDIVLDQLKIAAIDSLILSLPNRSTKLSLDDIKPFWSCAETFLRDGRTAQLGISDMDTNQLKQLYEWSANKPSTNHINLDACCVIPEDMSAFAKQNNIQLLTHNDPKDFLPEERFREIVAGIVGDADDGCHQWRRQWIARYSIIVSGKGILQNKGYILAAKRCPQ